MTDPAGQPPPDPSEPQNLVQTLARDWITVWESELAAMAVDREVQETWRAILAAWARAATALLSTPLRAATASAPGTGDEFASGQPGADVASRTAPVAAAFDPRDAEIATLAHQVARLEARIAELERGGSRGSHPRRLGKRRP